MISDEPSAIVQRKAHVAGLFDRTAATYDQVGPEIFAHFGRRLVDLAQISPGATVLDVAMGRGAVLFPAAVAAGARGYVTGIDISAAMVRETAAEIDRRGLAANATVVQMDGESLEFADESFDYTLCGLALMFFPQVESAMAELRRVLKPGGTLGVTTWDKSFSTHTRWLDEIVNAHLPPKPASNQPAAPPSRQRALLDTVDGLAAALEAAGFATVRVHLETHEIVHTSAEGLWSSLWSHGMRGALEQVEATSGADGLQRLKAAVLAQAAAIRQSDGIHQLLPVLFATAIKPSND